MRTTNKIYQLISNILWIILFIIIIRFLISYLPYFFKTNLTHANQYNQQLKTNILNHLQQLNSMPIVGRFFYKQKIQQLAILHNWERVISQSETALKLSTHQHTFSIWYLKGWAQCLLRKLDKCQESALKAIYYSSQTTKYQAQYLLNFLNKSKKQKQITKPQEQQQFQQVIQNIENQKKDQVDDKNIKKKQNQYYVNYYDQNVLSQM